jgi:ankyrin repeat protein
VEELGADVNQTTYDGFSPLHISAQKGDVAEVMCLVEELGADVNLGIMNGVTPLHAAADNADRDVMRRLVNDLGASVNQAERDGITPLHFAAKNGDIAVTRCLVEDLGANINQVKLDGSTPLMIAAFYKQAALVKWLIKAGADLQATLAHSGDKFTAADVSDQVGASFEQTTYLEAKAHCSNTGCSGTGLMKCTGCRKARYCGEACQLVHWKAHKADCKLWSAELKESTNMG